MGPVLLTLLAVALFVGLAAFIAVPLWAPPAGAVPSLAFRMTMLVLAGALLPALVAIVWVRQSRWQERWGLESLTFLRAYHRALGEATDVQQVAEALVRTAAALCGAERGALLLVHEVAWTYRLHPLPVLGSIPTEEAPLAGNSPFLRALRERQAPVFYSAIATDPAYTGMAAEERAWLEALAMAVYVPMISGDQLIGILALGQAPRGYGAHELALLRTLAQQTATTLHHLQLSTNLKALNSEIMALNRELREANERLQRVDAAKADFITIASHELRTPLTQVRGYVDLLAAMSQQGQLRPDQVAEIVTRMDRAAQRLEELVAAMLDASQIDIQALKLQYSETTLEAVLWLCLERMTGAMRERRHVFVMRGISDLPPVRVDVQRLTQAFCNVIGNAIKYTPDGGRITLSGRRLDNDRVEVVITDTGVGIDRDQLDLIFETFYRASRALLHSTGATKFMGGGPGLGLRIAKGVIEAHGGRIWAESAGYDPVNLPGSSFHIVLPLQPPASRNMA